MIKQVFTVLILTLFVGCFASFTQANTVVEILTTPNPITSVAWSEPAANSLWHELTPTGAGNIFTGVLMPTTGTDSVHLQLNDLVFALPNRPLINQWYVQIDTDFWPEAIAYVSGDTTGIDSGVLTPIPEPTGVAILALIGLAALSKRRAPLNPRQR